MVKVNSISKDLDAVVLFLALITPAMPKLKIADGIYMYIIEMVLLILLPFYLQKIKLKYQVYLLLFWVVILCSTILSYIANVEIGGFLRVIKGIIYIPLGFIAFQRFEPVDFKFFLKVFLIASVFNILVLLYNIKLYGINLWDVRTISSGLSNRYISLSNFKIGTIESGAHGIWGNYCILSFAINLFLKIKKEIGNLFFLVINIAVLLGFGLSVSREAMITLVFVGLGLLYLSGSFKRLKVNKLIFRWFAFIFVFIVVIVVLFGDKIPIIEKIIYTVDSVKNSGTEENIQLRVGGWLVYFESLFRNPDKIVTGFGFNHQYYVSFLNFAENKGNLFVTIPESFFVMALCYGGIAALIFAIYFFKELFKIALQVKDKVLRVLFTSFLCGLLIGNIFSGASVVSDLLYAQILILTGFLISHRDHEFTFDNIES